MPSRKSKPKAGEHGGPASPDLQHPQKGAAYYEGLREPKGRRAQLAENQRRAARRIGDDSQGPRR